MKLFGRSVVSLGANIFFVLITLSLCLFSESAFCWKRADFFIIGGGVYDETLKSVDVEKMQERIGPELIVGDHVNLASPQVVGLFRKFKGGNVNLMAVKIDFLSRKGADKKFRLGFLDFLHLYVFDSVEEGIEFQFAKPVPFNENCFEVEGGGNAPLSARGGKGGANFKISMREQSIAKRALNSLQIRAPGSETKFFKCRSLYHPEGGEVQLSRNGFSGSRNFGESIATTEHETWCENVSHAIARLKPNDGKKIEVFSLMSSLKRNGCAGSDSSLEYVVVPRDFYPNGAVLNLSKGKLYGFPKKLNVMDSRCTQDQPLRGKFFVREMVASSEDISDVLFSARFEASGTGGEFADEVLDRIKNYGFDPKVGDVFEIVDIEKQVDIQFLDVRVGSVAFFSNGHILFSSFLSRLEYERLRSLGSLSSKDVSVRFVLSAAGEKLFINYPIPGFDGDGFCWSSASPSSHIRVTFQENIEMSKTALRYFYRVIGEKGGVEREGVLEVKSPNTTLDIPSGFDRESKRWLEGMVEVMGKDRQLERLSIVPILLVGDQFCCDLN